MLVNPTPGSILLPVVIHAEHRSSSGVAGRPGGRRGEVRKWETGGSKGNGDDDEGGRDVKVMTMLEGEQGKYGKRSRRRRRGHDGELDSENSNK